MPAQRQRLMDRTAPACHRSHLRAPGEGAGTLSSKVHSKSNRCSRSYEMNGEGEVVVVRGGALKEKARRSQHILSHHRVSREVPLHEKFNWCVNRWGGKNTDGAGELESFLLLEEISRFVTHRHCLGDPQEDDIAIY